MDSKQRDWIIRRTRIGHILPPLNLLCENLSHNCASIIPFTVKRRDLLEVVCNVVYVSTASRSLPMEDRVII